MNLEEGHASAIDETAELSAQTLSYSTDHGETWICLDGYLSPVSTALEYDDDRGRRIETHHATLVCPMDAPSLPETAWVRTTEDEVWAVCSTGSGSSVRVYDSLYRVQVEEVGPDRGVIA